VRFIFFYIATLNLLDGAVTYYGLHHSIITEANPLMDSVYETGPHWFLILKVALSAFLFVLNLKGYVPDGKGIKALAMIAVTLYTGVCVLHTFWIIPYLF
jgi:Domain of unknown function (DUF5658)